MTTDKTDTMTLTIEIEPDGCGGYCAVIDDFFAHPGYGDTPSEAAVMALDTCSEWIDQEAPDATD